MNGNSGNYNLFALDGRGGKNFKDILEYGYDGEIKVGDIIETEPGVNDWTC